MTAPRVVLVHDWLTGWRGGEKCLEPAARCFPDAQLFTLFHARGRLPESIELLRPRTSPLNRLPGWPRYYRYLLPLMPLAAKWPLPPCDVVLSFSHCVAKAAQPPRGVPHICYCFTPMRYAWHMQKSYFETRTYHWTKKPIHAIRNQVLARLREWDQRTSSRVTHFIAISQTVRDRIQECYNRESVVIYPPVDVEYYTPTYQTRENYYLVTSALAPYKRFDLAVAACERLGRDLLVIGTGPGLAAMQAVAGPRTHFLGWQPDAVIRAHLRSCRALLFPGEEDFGIVPVEAMACGAPVVAFGRGGVAETVVGLGSSAEPTGVLFPEQTVAGVVAGLEQFEREVGHLDPHAARCRAEPFSTARYEAELFAYMDAVLAESARMRGG